MERKLYRDHQVRNLFRRRYLVVLLSRAFESASLAQMVVGAIGVAEENDVLWFGTQSNQTSLAPSIVVANQVYHWEVVLNEIIDSIHNGTLGGTSFTINLENGGEVIEYNPDYTLPAEVQTLADDTVQGIIDGSITIEMAE